MVMKKDDALTLSNPRLLSAAYFGVLAIIVTIALDTLIFAIGAEKIMPAFKAILLAVSLAACSGALFGERIVHCESPYRKRVFLWGFLMVIVALPIYDLGLIYLLQEYHPTQFVQASFQDILGLYLFVFIYSFILAGLWLAILSGLAAIYLRGHVVYYILQSTYKRPEHTHEVMIDSSEKNINSDDTT